MSCRVDSTLIAGACVVGDRGLGVLGSVIRATTGPGSGPNGAGYLYNDWQDSSDDGKEFRGLIVTPPSAGTFTAYEDGSISLTGAPDGTYNFVYRLYADGVDLGTAPATVAVGTPTVTATVAATGGVVHAGTAAIDATVVAPPPGVPGDLWNGVFLEAGLTPAAMLRIILAALVGRTVGIGTATEQYLSQDGTKPRITVSFDAQSNRVTVVLDGA